MLRVFEEVLDLDRAVGRPRGVQVQVGEDPVTVRERLWRLGRPSPLAEALVQLLELGADVGERLARDAAPRFLRELLAERLVLGEAGEGCGGELGLLLDARGRRDRRSGGGRFERHPREPVERRHEDRRLAEDRRPALAVARGPHARPAPQLRRHRRATGQLLRPQVDELPVRQLTERALDGTRERTLDRTPFEDDELPFLRRPEELSVDPFRDDPVLAGEALRRGVGRFRRRGDEGVGPREQLLALRLRGRVAEPLRREEAGHAERPRVPKGEVREAGQARLEAVHDVELPATEGHAQVRADADRQPDPAPARDRNRRPERDQRRLEAVAQRASSGGEVGRPVRGREDADRVAALTERVGDSRDVLVHVVRLRPQKGGHQADSQGHVHRV